MGSFTPLPTVKGQAETSDQVRSVVEAALAHILAPEASKPQDLPEVGCDVLGALYQQLGHSALQVSRRTNPVRILPGEGCSVQGAEGDKLNKGWHLE